MTGDAAAAAAAFLREQAQKLRELAGGQSDAALGDDLRALAARCEALANHMAGNGKTPDGR